MPKIAVISASLGGFDKEQAHEKQSIKCDFYHFNDASLPTRINALTPRLHARMVKMFSWQLVPNYDYYLWIDSSCRLSHKDSVKWFMDQIGNSNVAVFKHPHRNTVQEEANYLKERLEITCPYITPRYAGEDIDGQLAAVNVEAPLYASTAFIYRNVPSVQAALKEWWYHTTRFHSIDQLSFPAALQICGANVIDENYLKIPWIEYVRNKK